MRVLDTNLILAVRCSNCGKIKFHNISTFKLPVNIKLNLYCDCGYNEMNVTLKDNKTILADVPCLACDINHTYSYSLKDILRRKVTVICCSETELELCFMGAERDVKNIVSKYQEDISLLLGELGLFQDEGADIKKNTIYRK